MLLEADNDKIEPKKSQSNLDRVLGIFFRSDFCFLPKPYFSGRWVKFLHISFFCTYFVSVFKTSKK